MADGFAEVSRMALDLEKAAAEVRPKTAKIVAKAANDVETRAKQAAPVDTGNLRNSISTETASDGLSAVVGPTANYGAYVEYGTASMSPQPFMGPAWDVVEPGFVQALEELAGGVFE